VILEVHCLQEKSEKELIQISTATVFPYAVYFYSPLCGTCHLAERMLRIALEVGPCIPIFKININFSPQLMQQWNIQSVPCLCILQEGKLTNKISAIRSVDVVFEAIKVKDPKKFIKK
jgi:thioredoxin-like negative regulator of GroEL